MYNNEEQQYAPQVVMPSEKADLLDKIQPAKIVDKIYHRLMGEIEQEGQWVVDLELARRAFTKLGAREYTTLMLPVSSQNVSISKLKDHEIRARALSITKQALIMSLRNWREFGIVSSDQIGFIKEIVFSNSFITLKQPEGEGIRSMIKNIGSAEIGYQEPEQKQGWNVFRR
jgi:hypothetical protein